MAESLSKENRRSARIPVAQGIWVAWTAGGSRIVSRVSDLSAGGVFVTTRDPIPVGTVVEMLFSLHEGEIRMKGIVRFCSEKRGFGVEFTEMGVSDRARLLELLRRLKASR